MRIAQVAPLFESVPPRLYGGTERVVSYLTEALVREGHDVTLFASGDSITAARLVPLVPRSLRLDPGSIDSLPHHLLMLDRVYRDPHAFDLIHFHIDYLHFPLSRRVGRPQLTTLHGRLDIPDQRPLYREFLDMPLISISDAQRRPIDWANWQATIHHGLPPNLYEFREGRGGYLAFLGRISPEKRVDRAIAIAEAVGRPIRIAAKIDKADVDYFERVVKPLLDSPLVEFVGEIGEEDKNAFLGDAAALLFPIDWAEPFGLVMIEAMACGTPIVAWRGGSVDEVITEGTTGFVVDDLEAAIAATRRIDRLDRRRVRGVFDARFTSPRMADAYVAAYERVIAQWPGREPARVTPLRERLGA